MKLNGKRYTAKAAYVALDTRGDAQDAHGHRVWSTRVPNKVKIFSWLYYKDRLSTRANLFAKHILADEECEQCSGGVEDRHHVFFTCPVSAEVWGMLHFADVASLPDAETWEFTPPAGLDSTLWPFVLQTILWRLWDARNGVVFRAENPTGRSIVSRVCDDLVIWHNRLRDGQAIANLNAWRRYLTSCNSAVTAAPIGA